MGLISWIAVGLLSGLLAWLVMPGEDSGGIMVSILFGMGGGSVGGYIVSILGGARATGFNVWSILVATLGAGILLALYRLVARRNA